MKNQKILVGGYYDDRVFQGECFEGKTPFDKNIDTYTVEEALKLGFVENVIEWYEGNREDEEWDDLKDIEKAKLIEEYTLTDEIAGMNYFDTEKEAETYKNEVLEEIEELEKEIEEGKIKHIENGVDKMGYSIEIYERSDYEPKLSDELFNKMFVEYKTAVYCKNLDLQYEFLLEADAHGFRDSLGIVVSESFLYHECFCLFEPTYCDKKYYIENGYTIVEFEGFEKVKNL